MGFVAPLVAAMGGIGTVAAVGGALATAYGTYRGHKAQKAQANEQRRQQQVATRRERMAALRELQIQRASAMSSAQGAGIDQSSGALGGIGSLTSQYGTNAGFSSQMSAMSSNISRYSQQANFYSNVAQLGGVAWGWGNQKIKDQRMLQGQASSGLPANTSL